MPFMYEAEFYCDTCGERLREIIESTAPSAEMLRDIIDTGDSESWPVELADTGEADSPNHCASGEECLDALDLSEYGLAPDAELIGAESRKIGALIEESLTPQGREYLLELLTRDESPTPYQVALHKFWREHFGVSEEDTQAYVWKNAAHALGVEAAKSAASWIVDGNTSEDEAERMLAAIDACEFGESINYPNLSGEYADGPTPRSLFEDVTGRDAHADATFNADAYSETVDMLCDAWEEGCGETFESECERILRAHLGEPTTLPSGHTAHARYAVEGWPQIAVYIDRARYSGAVDVVMVGDDERHKVDVSELSPLGEDAYCPECGQIGCRAYH